MNTGGVEAVSPAVEQPQRKVHHTLACNTENRNAWISTSSPLYAFVESTGLFLLVNLTERHDLAVCEVLIRRVS